jgi:uncharacterized protein YcbX
VPTVSLLRIHPIKGLPPVDVAEVRVLPSGALELDRRWALLDAGAGFVNGKRFANIHLLRADYDVRALEVTFDGRTFSLTRQGPAIAAWCGDRLDQPLTWTENTEVGFPDDRAAAGPTFVSAASIREVAEWFGLDQNATRRRFRTNVEIGGAAAFWEDALYGRSLRLGDVAVRAVNPCARCVVPSRDAATGVVIAGFQKRFAELRRQHLPPGTSVEPFTHYYRFTVNTRIAPDQAGRAIRLGNEVRQA